MRSRPSRIHLSRIPSLSDSSERFAENFLTIHYSGMRLTWRENSQTSRPITTNIAPIAHSAVIRRLMWLEVIQNCKPHCTTSVGRLTAEGYTSFPLQIEYQFAMHRILNDFRGKPVTFVKACRATHPAMIAQATLNLSVPC